MKSRVNRVVVCGAVAAMPAVATAAQSRPNVIVIVADDLGWGDVGYHNQHDDIKSPNIDRLAAEGTHFSTAYVTNAVSSPSRAGMLTGRYQQRFGYQDNPGPFRAEEGIHPGIPSDVKTLPQYLKTQGYTSALIGKWHLGGEENNDSFPTRVGFDYFFGFLSGAARYFHENNIDNVVYRNEELAKMESGYFTDILGDEAVGFVNDNCSKPFFLYLAFNAVHSPLQAREDILAQYAHIGHKGRRELCAMQHSMDENIGKLMAELRRLKIEDNTIIFFFSDNGGASTKNFSYNTPFRGDKGTFFDGGVHTPFIVKWESQVERGRCYDKMCSTLDIAPTILSAAGIPIPEVMDGVDLMPYLKGERGDDHPHTELYWKMNSKYAVRDLEWKLLYNNPSEGVMLFNIAKDPYERVNLAESMPEKCDEMTAKFEAWSDKNPRPLWGWQTYVGGYIEHTYEGFEYINKLNFTTQSDGASVAVGQNPRRKGANQSDNVLIVEGSEGASVVVSSRVARFNMKRKYLHLKLMCDKPTEVRVTLHGDRGAKSLLTTASQYRTSGEWREFSFEVNHRGAVTAMSIEATLEEGATLYIDDISYSNNLK